MNRERKRVSPPSISRYKKNRDFSMDLFVEGVVRNIEIKVAAVSAISKSKVSRKRSIE